MSKSTVRILRKFFKLQAKENGRAITPDEERQAIEEILREPNPGVERAIKKGIYITIAKDDKIFRVAPDGTEEVIGTVVKDVPITQTRYSIQH